MSRLIASFFVLISILAVSLASSLWLDGLSQEMISQLEQAEQLALDGNWQQATQLTEQEAERWKDSSFPLHALLRHAETDDIQISFHQVLEYLEQEDDNLYTAINGQLITQLELLAEMEHPSWENVL